MQFVTMCEVPLSQFALCNFVAFSSNEILVWSLLCRGKISILSWYSWLANMPFLLHCQLALIQDTIGPLQ